MLELLKKFQCWKTISQLYYLTLYKETQVHSSSSSSTQVHYEIKYFHSKRPDSIFLKAPPPFTDFTIQITWHVMFGTTTHPLHCLDVINRRYLTTN